MSHWQVDQWEDHRCSLIARVYCICIDFSRNLKHEINSFIKKVFISFQVWLSCITWYSTKSRINSIYTHMYTVRMWKWRRDGRNFKAEKKWTSSWKRREHFSNKHWYFFFQDMKWCPNYVGITSTHEGNWVISTGWKFQTGTLKDVLLKTEWTSFLHNQYKLQLIFSKEYKLEYQRQGINGIYLYYITHCTRFFEIKQADFPTSILTS